MLRERLLSYPLELACRVICVWPGTANALLYRLLWSVSMVITQYLQYRNLLRHVRTDDKAGLVEGFTLTITYTLIFARIALLWLYERILAELLEAMSADWRVHATADWQLQAMTRKADLSDICAKAIVGFYAVFSPLFNSGVLWTEYARDVELNGTGRDPVMLRTMFAIDGRVSPFREIFVVQQLCQQVTTCVVAAAVTVLMLSFVLHADGQIEIIRRQLNEISPNPGKLGTVCERLRTVIERHQRVVHFCEDVEIIFTYMALMEFIVMALLFGCVWFVLSVSDDVLKKAVLVIYFMGIILDFTVYCNIGEYLREKSLAVGQSVYECVWYDLKPAECQILLVLLLRAQRRLAITAGKFVDLSREVFATAMKTSMSIVSLFFAVY